MFEVCLWVPTKGWKTMLRTKQSEKAIGLALMLVPLEVKLIVPNGRTYHSGILHMRTMSDKIEELTQIEEYAGRLGMEVATDE